MYNEKNDQLEKIHKQLIAGEIPDSLMINNRLQFTKEAIRSLPTGLKASAIKLIQCDQFSELPGDIKTKSLTINLCNNFDELPSGLHLFELAMISSNITKLPDDIKVDFRVDLTDSIHFHQLPENFKTGSLILTGCRSLKRLPEGLDVCFLDLRNCVNFYHWPKQGSIKHGRLNVSGCVALTKLPTWLKEISQLDLSGCINITHLPEDLKVTSWIDIAATKIDRLPERSKNAQLRWRGVTIDKRIAFHPESITAKEILRERNAELRRVKLERMGYQAFLEESSARTIDQDQDAGGPRRLLRVYIPDDEDLYCVSVLCPSTSRQYIIRVPPTMRTCHQALAWIAGFDNPDDYKPLIET